MIITTVCRDFLDGFAVSANAMLQLRGFSCGINDCVIDRDVYEKIAKTIESYKGQAKTAINIGQLGALLIRKV